MQNSAEHIEHDHHSTVEAHLESEPHHHAAPASHQTLLTFAGLCGVLTFVGEILPSQSIQSFFVYGLAFFFGARYAAAEALHALRHGNIDVHLLMVIVALGAVLVGSPTEAGILLFLFSLSHGLETLAEYRTERAIRDLYKSYPNEALRRVGDKWERVSVDLLKLHDQILVGPGDLFACDGIVLEGETSVDEAALTGESIPVKKSAKDKVFGGTTNLDGQIVSSVTALPKQSAVAKVMGLVEDAKRKKAPAQRFTDLIGSRYTVCVLVFSLLAFLGFCLFSDLGVKNAFYRSMVLLVVASPCALVISIPSAILAAIASGARRGVLFRGGKAVEELATVDLFALDKTGTVTLGRLRVERVIPYRGSESDVLRAAASAEEHLSHPLAQAIVAAAHDRGLSFPTSTGVQNTPGHGLTAVVNGEKVYVGNRAFVLEAGFDLPPEDARSLYSEVYVATPTTRGILLLADELRTDAQQVMNQLRENGARVSMLSGDKDAVVRDVANRLGVSDFQAQLTPSDKLNQIRKWQSEGHRVAMTGDGINDAPSLAAANVSIVLGDRASDVATEQADVVLMGGQIKALPIAVKLSRNARRVIFQNLTLSLLVVLTLVTLSLFGEISLTVGVLGHEGSTVVVVLNSLRLLSLGTRSAPKPTGKAPLSAPKLAA